MKHESIQQAVTSTPPVAVAGMTFLGFPLTDWVQILALVWLALQISYFIWSKYRTYKKS